MNVTDPGIMQRLREETAENHKFAESRDFEQAMASGQLPQPLYVRMLEQRYLIHRELERQVQRLTEAHPYVATVIEQQLLQEPNLQADLEFFGIDVDAVKPCEATRTLIGHIQEAA